ncbi:hypothetical protein ABT158_25860 [Nonomuraea sp. NPDC001636]|uniref:hypothetical protein n=1 Tax=Nonomuraea sp. NPDC001636 TaxID=3154391 RepID=UPI0033312FF4
MVLLGLILVLLAGGAVALVATEESSRYILFGNTYQLDHVQMFLAGAVVAAALLAGIWLIGAGSRRTARKRRRLRAARAEESDRVSRLEDEKRDLERRLERDRNRAAHDGVTDGGTDGRVAHERVASERAAHEPVDGDRLVAGGGRPDDTRP